MECDGKRFACKINGTEVSGRITVEEGEVYLCQNEQEGNNCENKRGYKYSWSVEDGHPDRLSFNKVTDFRLYPLTRSDVDAYKDWQVGDKVTNENHPIYFEPSEWQVVLRSGEVVICKDKVNICKGPYTCDGLYDYGFRLVPEELEEDTPVDVTLEEIAAWKGVDAGQIRIVDKAVNG